MQEELFLVSLCFILMFTIHLRKLLKAFSSFSLHGSALPFTISCSIDMYNEVSNKIKKLM